MELGEINRHKLLEILCRTEIDLSNKYINEINLDTFKGLGKLEKLSLHSNKIRELKKGVFDGLSNLKQLRLENNKLNRIDPSTFEEFTKLVWLYLQCNELEEIDVKLFENLSNLKCLYLSNNKLKRIDSNAFRTLNKLETLHLEKNELTQLDEGIFHSLSNLKVLDLHANKLKRIDSNLFKELIKLEELSLEENEIEEIGIRSFQSLSSLTILKLNNNKLKCIDRKCFESFKSITILLYENDFKALSFSTDISIWGLEKLRIEKKGYNFISDWKIFLVQFDTNEFYNPKLFIVDYYDSLISDIDIYTEELLEKYNEKALLEENPKEKDSLEFEKITNPYKIEYKNELMINLTPKSTKIHEYLNLVRSKAIEEINKAKEENLERYEINKDKYKYDRNDLSVQKVQEIKGELFKERFCFSLLLKADDNFNKTKFIKSNTIVFITDFYLNNYDRLLIGNFLSNNSISYYMDDLCLLLISSYINGFYKSCGNEVISIKKDYLQKIEHINFEKSQFSEKIDCTFKLSHGFQDLSQIKSIDVRNECVNLRALKNLEYLSLNGVMISKVMFIALEKLIGLSLHDCFFPHNIDRDLFVENLQCLEIIDSIYRPQYDLVLLNWFKNLKKLRVSIREHYIENLDFLKFESLSNLEYLYLNECKIKILLPGAFSKLKRLKYIEMDSSFYFQPDIFLGLDNLEILIIKPSSLNNMKVSLIKGVFNGLRSLKTLDLSSSNIEYIDPEVFIHMPMLSDFRIGRINCKLDKNTFIPLYNVKTIEVSKSDLNQINSTVLEALSRSNIKIIIR